MFSFFMNLDFCGSYFTQQMGGVDCLLFICFLVSSVNSVMLSSFALPCQRNVFMVAVRQWVHSGSSFRYSKAVSNTGPSNEIM